MKRSDRYKEKDKSVKGNNTYRHERNVAEVAGKVERKKKKKKKRSDKGCHGGGR